MNKRGFTLVELLVVIAIIGVLISVVLANLATARAKGRDARRAADTRQLQQAVENYFEDYSFYPQNLSDANLLRLLTNSPTDPSTGKTYGYFVNTNPAIAYCIGLTFEVSVPSSLGPYTACPSNVNFYSQSRNPKNYVLQGP